jgi:hypothetical protein
MIRISFHNDADDCQWLKDTHLRFIDHKPFESFVLHGNEDAPDIVDLYGPREPLATDKPQRFEFSTAAAIDPTIGTIESLLGRF